MMPDASGELWAPTHGADPRAWVMRTRKSALLRGLTCEWPNRTCLCGFVPLARP
jgi:hypothetical protein